MLKNKPKPKGSQRSKLKKLRPRGSLKKKPIVSLLKSSSKQGCRLRKRKKRGSRLKRLLLLPKPLRLKLKRSRNWRKN